MKKERLFYLDFVRAVAAVSIVITHFNARYLYLNPPMPEKAVLTTTVSNIYIGDWGVSLFFIISGAALMYVYEKKCELKTFYKKRFFSIYPMFWMAYIAAFIYSFYADKMMPGTGVPKWRFIFTVTGFDGLLMTNGYGTFYILGEWFLGVIILMYLVFPLLRKAMNAKPLLLLAAVVVMYVAGLWLCYRGPYPVVAATMLFIRFPEIVFGMFFVKCSWKVDWKAALAAFVVLVLNGVLKPGFLSNIQTTYVGIASFVVLVYLSYFVKFAPVEKVCGVLSKYSYAIFLVHHVIIDRVMASVDLVNISVKRSYLLFVVICCMIAVFAWLLFFLHKKLMGCILKLRAGK
ncbi:acyltransferase [Dorea acetigenes]|jgi:peptidoglycan/LPS O-acetylase OafA/YrhL|uniref:Acyltransferase n=1 Tax=Dorea acetigenes TaxID=2981787 RepID=A0ABT2RIT5_9FIRM|nr:acyltransferase [Dorea acetigenes]MCU6685273.1 acyltransferase [Dorea acetigenes]SCI42395.1 Uncharacterized protein conserved in bacteria [uncultured Clostridium sp.]